MICAYGDMKHLLRKYEALAFARMKRSTFFVPNVPKACFIAEGDFIFHTPSGVLHSAKTKRQAMPVFLFWRRRRDLNPRAGYPTYALSRGASSPLEYYSKCLRS